MNIDARPAVVAEKTRLGDWEADTVIGKNHKGVLVTLTERVSKFTLAIPVVAKTAELVQQAITNQLNLLKDWVYTITFDNGREFCHHQKIAALLACDTYFAKPYHSWERGLNENHNGLLRQYFPKNEQLDGVSSSEVFQAVHQLNHRPRKTLGYKTPYEVFCQLANLDVDFLSSVAFIT